MKIEMRNIDEVHPYPGNPRKNEDAVDAVAASIREFGFRVPIVVDEQGIIICGHTRLLAARQLGLTQVPVHVAVGLTPEQAKGYRLADNRLHELSSWDMELLPIELSELRSMDVDLQTLGFDSAELEQMLGAMGTDGLTDPDAVPDQPDAATTQPGDLWVLGDHRLLCADSSKAEDVDRLLGGEPIHLVNTDPPYNVHVEPRSNTAIAAGVTSVSRREDIQCEHSQSERGKKDRENMAKKMHHQAFDTARGVTDKSKAKSKMRAKDRPLINDFVSGEEFDRLLLAWFGNMARVLLPGHCFYIWGGYANLGNYPSALKACELYFSQGVVWDKQHPVLTRKDMLGAFELCFYGWREGAGHKWYGPNNAQDIWHIKKVNPAAMVHLTEKPAELASRAMMYSSKPGENVLDLFGGSGSTLIAAEQTGRHAFLMELDELYCDVIVQRWEEFTGRKATRTEDEPQAKKKSRAKIPAKGA